MKCRKCKSEIPDGSKFCMLCGAKQELKQGRKTRGNGQGTAIKRGNTWTAVWTTATYVDGDNLRQKQKWKGGFRTKTAALAYAANPEPDMKKPTTLRDYWRGWESSDMLDLSQSKKTAFKIAWNRLGTIADTEVSELTIIDLQSSVDAETETYYPAKDMKTLLSHLYKRAVAEGNARTNLAQFIRLPPLNERETQPFKEDELKKLWDAYGGERVMGAILLMIYTAMMPGELMALKQDMIDWQKHEIVGCGLKTKKRKETPIVFPDFIEPVLKNLVQTSPSAVGYVLGMNKDRFYKEYYAALEKAEVRLLPPYSCRHTTATALALGNIAPSVIQKVMRHTKFTTTQRYIHPDTADAHAAVNAFSVPTARTEISDN